MIENIILRIRPNSFILPELSGSRTIAGAAEIFDSYSSAFAVSPLDKPAPKTPRTILSMYELYNNARLIQMLGFLPGTWEQKILSQDQIIEMVVSHPELWMFEAERAVIFFISSDPAEKFISANIEGISAVCIRGDGNHRFKATHYEIDHMAVWRSFFAPLIIAPFVDSSRI